ncbi:cytosolic phospholipase A2 gamma-like [Misgurnus anguillicaudatus]|uniref:cytosolic phospholipase A2 gamma-like n=1 Tax=Misgurnus anguillicaudatus TaxID=75329 RepID=UPI003CCF6B2E
MNMSASKPQMSGDVRIGHSLNKHEEEFVNRRLKTVQQSLKKLGIDCTLDNVPKIALLGSGGGERAMLGLLGCLDKLEKIGLLDCILYLSGVSGSTWCMTSLYQEPNWSTKVNSVKEKILQTHKGSDVGWRDTLYKLKKYYDEKGMLSLTDVWAVIIITLFVKEINEHKVSEQQVGHDKDPFPIYNVIDKGCRQQNDGDPWFEITPYEAGYSVIGAFVDVSKFGSNFQAGRKIKHLPVMDMLYLQSLCGSAIADGEIDIQYAKKMIEEYITTVPMPSQEKKEDEVDGKLEEDSTSPTIEEVHQLFLDLVEMNISALKGEDTSPYEEAIKAKLSALCGSCIADGEINAQYVWEKFKGFFNRSKENIFEVDGKLEEDSTSPTIEEVHQLFLDLVEMNLAALKGEDTSPYEEAIKAKISELQLELDEIDETDGLLDSVKRLTAAVSESLKSTYQSAKCICVLLTEVYGNVIKSVTEWIWGRKYNFLYQVKDDSVPIIFRDSKQRDYEDAGILNNSPYISVLRQERDVDLIISLDFSDEDPFDTVKKAADRCKKENIPFPKVDIPSNEIAKDFYVFEGHGEAPTVIHIPLFNIVNCGVNIEEWRREYRILHLPYSPKRIDSLLNIAGKNITNNKEKLLDEIIKCIGVKSAKH